MSLTTYNHEHKPGLCYYYKELSILCTVTVTLLIIVLIIHYGLRIHRQKCLIVHYNLQCRHYTKGVCYSAL